MYANRLSCGVLAVCGADNNDFKDDIGVSSCHRNYCETGHGELLRESSSMTHHEAVIS